MYLWNYTKKTKQLVMKIFKSQNHQNGEREKYLGKN